MSFNSGKTGAQVMAALAGGSGDSPISFKGNGTATEATPWRVTNISPNAKNFNFSLNTFPGVNLPAGDSRENNVFNMGWNVATNGDREDPSQAMLRLGFEEHFKQPGRPAAFEWHLSSVDESGQEHRPLSAYLHKDGSPGSYIEASVDHWGFNDYNYVQKIKFDFMSDVVTFYSPIIRVEHGGVFIHQKNSAGTGYIGHWSVDPSDSLRAEAPLAVYGPAPTTGTYPGQFVTFDCSSLPTNGKALTVSAPHVSGSHYLIDLSGSCTQYAIAEVSNSNTSSTASTMLSLVTAGPMAGDPYVSYSVAQSGGQWTSGLDNSDDGAFVWSEHWLLGNNLRLRLDRNGTLSLPTSGSGLRVTEGSNCKQGTATLAAGTVTVANTSVTANSRIFLTGQADGGTPGFVRVSSRVPGTSFTITSSSGTDTSTVAYEIFEPA